MCTVEAGAAGLNAVAADASKKPDVLSTAHITCIYWPATTLNIADRVVTNVPPLLCMEFTIVLFGASTPFKRGQK